MLRALAPLLVVTGCDKLFDLRPVDEGVDREPGEDAGVDSVSADGRRGDAATGACPASYITERDGSRYRYVADASSWAAARIACAADQVVGSERYTHLAVLTSDAERTFVHVAAMGAASSSVWIGLTDLASNGTYRWITTEPPIGYPSDSTGWAAGQPNDPVSNSCVRMAPALSLGFDDDDCPTQYHFVCECDAYPVDATVF